jgi:hypothetical protein
MQDKSKVGADVGQNNAFLHCAYRATHWRLGIMCGIVIEIKNQKSKIKNQIGIDDATWPA